MADFRVGVLVDFLVLKRYDITMDKQKKITKQKSKAYFNADNIVIYKDDILKFNTSI